MRYDVRIGDKRYQIDLQNADDSAHRDRSKGQWRIQLNGREFVVEGAPIDSNTLSMILDGQSFEARKERISEGLRIVVRGNEYKVSVEDPRSLRSRKRRGLDDAGPQRLVSSMPGKVVRILAREGDKVLAGDGLVVVEAMKMQNEIKSPKSGVLTKVLAKTGVNVNAGDVLAIVQ
jgi:biotin carboxyl carrier protein